MSWAEAFRDREPVGDNKSQTTDHHEIDLDIRPPLPAGKVLVIMVRDRQCFHRIVDAADAAILNPLFAEAISNG